MAATLVVAGCLAVAGAGSASAHSSMVGGAAECRPDGTVSVTWIVTNDYRLPLRVTQTGNTGGGSVTGLPVTIDAVSSSGNTTATVQQVGITPGTPTATLGVHGAWSDGYTAEGLGSVPLPQDCRPATTGVTPVEPTVVQSAACDTEGTLTVPSTEGVEYFLDGTPIAAGDHSGPVSGTRTAKAVEGYELTGTRTWTVQLAAATTCESGSGETGGGGDTTPPVTPPVTQPATPPATQPASPVPADLSTSAEVSTPAASELAHTGVSPQTWTYGVGGGLALLLLGGVLTVAAARLRR
jgi:hypothetical protein